MESLFSSIIKYPSTTNVSPQENFLTELFCWLINNIHTFAYSYVCFLCKENGIIVNILDNTIISAKTQYYVGNRWFIDMVIELKAIDMAFICEHKVDSPLSDGQIEKYMNCQSDIINKSGLHTTTKFYSVLLTKSRKQFTQEADCRLLWREVDALVERIIEDNEIDSDERFILKQFSMFLKDLGIGQIDPIDIDLVKNYLNSGNPKPVEQGIERLFRDLECEDWKSIIKGIDSFRIDEKHRNEYRVGYEKRWGRIGLSFFRDWNPNIFAGVIYKPYDHKIEYCDPNAGPDFVVLLDILEENANEFNNLSWTKDVRERLSDPNKRGKFKEFVMDPENPWRLFILQRPLYYIIEEKRTIDDQRDSLIEAIREGVELFIKNEKDK